MSSNVFRRTKTRVAAGAAGVLVLSGLGVAALSAQGESVEGTATASSAEVAAYQDRVLAETCSGWRVNRLGANLDSTDRSSVALELARVNELMDQSNALSGKPIRFYLGIYASLLDQHAPPTGETTPKQLQKALDAATTQIEANCRQ